MVAAQQYRRRRQPRHHLGPGVMGTIQQPPEKRILHSGFIIAQCPRQAPGHCVYQYHGRKLSAAEYVISNGPLLVNFQFHDPFINAFIPACDQDERVPAGKVHHVPLPQLPPLGRQADHRGRGQSLPGVAYGCQQRLRHHDHAGPAAIRPVIHGPVTVRCVIPWINRADLQQSGTGGFPGNAIVADRSKHLRKQRNHLDR